MTSILKISLPVLSLFALCSCASLGSSQAVSQSDITVRSADKASGSVTSFDGAKIALDKRLALRKNTGKAKNAWADPKERMIR